MNSTQSLDQQYLNFLARTGPIFTRYPEMEPLRYFIFKQLLARRRGMRWPDHIKHWLYPLLRRARTRGPLNRADVLLWIESRREVIVDAVLPVYRELTSRGLKVQLVSFKGPDRLPPSTLHFQFPARARRPAWAKEAWQALCGVAEELCDRALRGSFYSACAEVQSLFDELDRILDAVNPKIVLIASTQLIGGATLAVASRSQGALTLLLQHGILQPFYLPLLTDYMVTWGPSSTETLARLGVPHQRLLALGSPRHDAMLPSIGGNSGAALRDALSLPEKPTFVFFSNGNDLVRNGDAPRECAKWLETTAARYAGHINVIVRLHPNEDGALYREYPHLRIIKGLPDLATTLDGCDWVGSLCSTVLYDALLYKKPVWQFYADGWPELADNWKFGLATRISSQAELDERVHRMLCEGAKGFREENLSDRVFSNHGHATQAVADFVQGQLEEGGGRFQDGSYLDLHPRPLSHRLGEG